MIDQFLDPSNITVRFYTPRQFNKISAFLFHSVPFPVSWVKIHSARKVVNAIQCFFFCQIAMSLKRFFPQNVLQLLFLFYFRCGIVSLWMAGQFLDPSNDTGPDYLFLIFSQFSQIFSHERKFDKKKSEQFLQNFN